MGRLTEDMTNLRGEIDALRNGRVEFIAGLKQNVFELKAGFNSNHAEMAAKLRDDLDAFVSELKNDVVELKAGFNSDHAEMAGELRDGLETFVSDLKGFVADLRQEAADDIAGGHKAWFGPAPAELKAIKAAEKRKKKKEMEMAQLDPDDLTQIKGIGPSRQELLNEAGIFTIAQLAGITPQQLEQILGESARKIDLKACIKQAKRL